MHHVLSIQSWVAYGHVGNAAAIFPLQRLGCEVWGIHTVQFSNHTGYGAWKGRVLEASFVQEVLDGIFDRGVMGQCNAVLSGYLGDASVGEVVLSAVKQVKEQNPAALYCCDPVMGDHGRGFFVRPGIPEFFRDNIIPYADILTPNHFELEYLTEQSISSTQEAISAARMLIKRGPRMVLITSFRQKDAPPNTVQMLLVSQEMAWLVSTPLLPVHVNGTGDLMASLFLGHFLRSKDPKEALFRATAAIYGVLHHTDVANQREIQLIAAQNELVDPSKTFPVETIAF